MEQLIPSTSPAQSAASPPNDAWVADLLRLGESASAGTIGTLRAFVYRAIRHGLGGKREADAAFIEDVTQDATLRILKGLPSFRGDSRFTTWATTVAMRVAFTELRHARWKDVSLDNMLDADGKHPRRDLEPTGDEQAERGVARQEMLDTLQSVMRRDLTDRQRQALLAVLEGIPPSQLAERMGTNANAIYKLVHDARKKLKAGLIAAGVREEDVRSNLEE